LAVERPGWKGMRLSHAAEAYRRRVPHWANGSRRGFWSWTTARKALGRASTSEEQSSGSSARRDLCRGHRLTGVPRRHIKPDGVLDRAFFARCKVSSVNVCSEPQDISCLRNKPGYSPDPIQINARTNFSAIFLRVQWTCLHYATMLSCALA
jgi:hypothetical protein